MIAKYDLGIFSESCMHKMHPQGEIIDLGSRSTSGATVNTVEGPPEMSSSVQKELDLRNTAIFVMY